MFQSLWLLIIATFGLGHVNIYCVSGKNHFDMEKSSLDIPSFVLKGVNQNQQHKPPEHGKIRMTTHHTHIKVKMTKT